MPRAARYDLLCNVGGWPRDFLFARVVGWAFFAKKRMSFQRYQSKIAVGRRGLVHQHQINHKGGHPEDCTLDHLELGDADYNRAMYSSEAKDLHGSVFKRPAVKRPASAMR